MSISPSPFYASDVTMSLCLLALLRMSFYPLLHSVHCCPFLLCRECHSSLWPQVVQHSPFGPQGVGQFPPRLQGEHRFPLWLCLELWSPCCLCSGYHSMIMLHLEHPAALIYVEEIALPYCLVEDVMSTDASLMCGRTLFSSVCPGPRLERNPSWLYQNLCLTTLALSPSMTMSHS